MARPANTIPSKKYKVCIPLDIATTMELQLFSELEGRIPQGGLSGYIVQLIRNDQERIRLAQLRQRSVADDMAAIKGVCNG